MSALQLALAIMIGVWAGFRLAVWWHNRSLDRIINDRMAGHGLQVSDEVAQLLRRPTVDGVARKLIRKWGLCAHADILLQGVPITLVCHDKALLQRALDAIHLRRSMLQEDMELALASARADQAVAKIKTGLDTRRAAPAAPEGKRPAPFEVIDGDLK